MQDFDFVCRPAVAWLTVNRQCNLRCVWCYGENTHYDPKDTMSLETAKELVRTNVEAGVTYINIIGGEPTMWPHLSELNAYCKSLGVTTCLVTNAVRFADDEYWELYLQNPCDEVSVSVKSADQDAFAVITGSRLYAQMMKGIERVISHYQAGASTVYNSLVGIDGLKQIATVCRELGARHFVVDLCTPVITDEGISQGYSIEPEQLAKDIMVIQKFLDELYEGKIEIAVYIPLCLFPASFIKEMMGKHQLTTICHVQDRSGLNFDINGDVILCNQLFDSRLASREADYHDGQTLLDHLNCDQLRADYQQLLRFPSEACSECRWNRDCRGGCLLNWTLYDPSICHAVTIPQG